MCILTLEEITGKPMKQRPKLAMMDLKLAVVFLAVLHLSTAAGMPHSCILSCCCILLLLHSFLLLILSFVYTHNGHSYIAPEYWNYVPLEKKNTNFQLITNTTSILISPLIGHSQEIVHIHVHWK